MTKSSPTHTSDIPEQEIRQVRSGPVHGLLVLIFRLLLLGVGGTIAALVGIVIAQFYPAPQSQNTPLLERVIESSHDLASDLKRLPELWSGKPEPAPSDAPTAAAAPSAPPASTAPATAPTQLSDAERQQLQAEFNQIQADLQKLNDRAANLEQRTGSTPAGSTVEDRLQNVQQHLSSNASPAPSPAATLAQPLPVPVTTDRTLKVTLPSDTLFNADQKTLRPGTEAVLDNIATELKRYPGMKIQIGAFTDSQGSAAADRDRTFEQAKEIQQYLAGKLNANYHLVVVGYGHSRPLTEGSAPADRQRNRRIEIVIAPK